MSDSFVEVEIVVFPEGLRLTCPKGVRLHEALARSGLQLTTPCGGSGTCGKCSVRVMAIESFPNDLTALQKTSPLQQVLACQYVVNESLAVWFPKPSLLTDDVQIVVSHATFESNDDENIPLTTDMLLGRDDQQNCRHVAAVDIGTTTIAVELLSISTHCDARSITRLGVASGRNPQSEFGDDVISRIQYASESPEHLKQLREKIVDAINALINELTHKGNISPQQIDLIALAGNTTMQQLFAGLDVQSLGYSPFVPATKNYSLVRASDYGLAIGPDGMALVFPVIGGFVGGDIVAGIVAVQMCSQTAPTLLIDIGTNGEIVLWHPADTSVSPGGVLLTAATAAGPAFEGARIQHGMIAAPGAIERVTLDGELHIETIGNRRPRGICGSGLIDLVAELVRVGAIAGSGKLLSGDKLPESVPLAIQPRFVSIDKRPSFVVVPQSESDTGTDILLTQHDIRQVQLAAGAVRAGVTLLLNKAGIKPNDLAAIDLAGGFGNYIRRENAKQIGLLPPEIPTERIRFCGNTSLAGVKAVLLNANRYREMQSVAANAECVDLSTFPEFATVFAESMLFPAPEK